MTRSDRALPAAFVLAITLALSCGGGRTPSTPTPSGSPPPPSPTPVAWTCPFGNGSAEASCSRATDTQLLSRVDEAIEKLAQQQPGPLDVSDQDPKGSSQYRIVDPKGFIDGVLANLHAAGLCADPDYDYPLDRISVKASNDFSEDFGLVMSSGHVRRGISSYRGSCSPAAFPVDPDPSWPPSGSGCGRPYPPPIHHFNSKVWLPGTQFATLDSTPIVGPDSGYCRTIGYRDGRAYCPVRGDGSPERVPCENWRVGKAKDTGEYGPTWYLCPSRQVNTDYCQYCKGLDVNGCAHDPENPNKLFAAKGGTYIMCGENGASGRVDVGR